MSMSILVLMSWTIYLSVWTLLMEWENSKMKIEMQSEISALLATIKSYTTQTDQFLITPSILWTDENKKEYFFSNLILKNKITSSKKDLFTIIKPIEWKLKDNEVWLFPNDAKFNVWVTGFNIFNDLVYDKVRNMIYFSNTGLWNIEFYNLNNDTNGITIKKKWILLSWLKNPTWLTLSDDNKKLYFSENWNHTIRSIDWKWLNSDAGTDQLNQKIELVAWTPWEAWFWWNQLNSPNWLSYYNWYIYIVDSWNNAIKALNIDSWIITILAAKKQWDDNFKNLFLDNPTDIEYIKDLNSIVFTDTNNNRVILCKLKTKILIKDNCTVIAWAWEAWFSWDFTTAKQAQLNRPTWITVDTLRTMYVSDSWNNLIRKIYTIFTDQDLSDNQSLIKTVIWNSSIKILSIWADWIYDTFDDIRESIKAPIWWYSDVNVIMDKDIADPTGGNVIIQNYLQKNTDALLNIPTWIALIDSSPIFIDSFNGSLRAWILWHTKKWSILLSQTAIIDENPWEIFPTGTWKIITLIRKWIVSINTDDIWLSRMDDFVSNQAIYRMFFDIKTLSNPLIKLRLSVVNYNRPDSPIYTDLETSFTLRD